MANTASAKKADRQNDRHRLHNRYYAKTTRNAIRDIRNTTDKAAAEQLAPKVFAMIDKLAKTNIIHKNKAANLKSSLSSSALPCIAPQTRRLLTGLCNDSPDLCLKMRYFDDVQGLSKQ